MDRNKKDKIKGVPTKNVEGGGYTVLKWTELWEIRDKMGEILNTAECHIPKELLGAIIIGVVAMWTGKPVKMFDDTKGGGNVKASPSTKMFNQNLE